jgi:hypothetical protein
MRKILPVIGKILFDLKTRIAKLKNIFEFLNETISIIQFYLQL